jgi:hypothetical protein
MPRCLWPTRCSVPRDPAIAPHSVQRTVGGGVGCMGDLVPRSSVQFEIRPRVYGRSLAQTAFSRYLHTAAASARGVGSGSSPSSIAAFQSIPTNATVRAAMTRVRRSILASLVALALIVAALTVARLRHADGERAVEEDGECLAGRYLGLPCFPLADRDDR